MQADAEDDVAQRSHYAVQPPAGPRVLIPPEVKYETHTEDAESYRADDDREPDRAQVRQPLTVDRDGLRTCLPTG